MERGEEFISKNKYTRIYYSPEVKGLFAFLIIHYWHLIQKREFILLDCNTKINFTYYYIITLILKNYKIISFKIIYLR